MGWLEDKQAALDARKPKKAPAKKKTTAKKKSTKES